MDNTRFLTDFLKIPEEMFNRVFRDQEGRLYRPIELKCTGNRTQLLIAFMDKKVIRTRYVSPEEASKHKCAGYYSRHITAG